MIKKFLKWALSKFDDTPEVKEPAADAWPFPVVLGTPPAAPKATAKKRGRPAGKKPAVKAKATVKRIIKKKAK